MTITYMQSCLCSAFFASRVHFLSNDIVDKKRYFFQNIFDN